MSQLTERKACQLRSSGLLGLAKKRKVIVTKQGTPAWAIVPLHGQDWESFVVSRSLVFRRIFKRARRSFRAGGGLSLEAVKKRYKLK